MTRDWPAALRRYVGPTPSALTLTPDRWATGQMTVMVFSTIFFLLGCVGVVATHDRASSLGLACCGAVGVVIVGRQRLRWVRIETTDDAVNITPGLWRRTSATLSIRFAEIQTVRVGKDTKGYGWQVPILRHVVIEHTAPSGPFASIPAGVAVAEMFGLDVPVLEALRDELAARSGKEPMVADV